jgi:hypothetical protein
MNAQPTNAELLALIAKLKADNEALKANVAAPRKLTMKVTAIKPDGTGTSGAISVYGLGRFPVTLYAASWERLLDEADTIRAFITANAATISRKA